MNENVRLFNGDCLDVMDKLVAEGIKVDAIITDIPQEITQNTWDNIIPFEDMWERTYKIRKSKTTHVILFNNQPFTSLLIASNYKHFKVIKYWKKNRPSGFLNAKRMPLKDMEEIAIFYEKQPIYNPIMIEGLPNHSIGKVNGEKECKNNNNYGKFGRVETEGNLKYPRQLMEYDRPHPPMHPTQKPVDLIEDLIKTYTNEGDIVLDFTMGSGSTGVASINTNIKFVGIELDEGYFKIASDRIHKAIQDKESQIN